MREGEKPSKVIADHGMCRTGIYRWLRADQRGGEKALASRKARGPRPHLTGQQKLRVRGWIDGKDPRKYGFQQALWTRKIVGRLIQQKLDVHLGVTAVGRVLAEVDMTPQKPLRRAYERDPKAIQEWQDAKYPKIKARARKSGARIHFLDEAGVRSDAVLGKTWGVTGKTPTVPTSGQRQGVNAISAINELGAFWYETYAGTFNKERFVGSLRHFMRRRGKVVLILDCHPSHRAKIVSEYVHSLKGRLELHFLPGYAPELDPDESAWNHLKDQSVSKTPPVRTESLGKRVDSDLRKIQGNRARAVPFDAPSVAYVKD